MTKFDEALGRAAGWAVGPVFALASWVRDARVFHPSGVTVHAAIRKSPDAPVELHPLADRLAGYAMVRFSGALWKREGKPDVLGCAVRFHRHARDKATASDGDLDLLFATAPRVWTLPLATLTTDVHDYLGNDYFAVVPFDVGAPRRVYFRIHPPHPAAHKKGTRSTRLGHELKKGSVSLRLEAGESPTGPWRPLLNIVLERFARVDGQAIRFHPFRGARGVHPRGFVNALRIGAYTLSQLARPKGDEAHHGRHAGEPAHLPHNGSGAAPAAHGAA
ncbi:MAG TPA: hypothetical protein VGI39_41755 [Polyangiaceae bacterium]|jgi:hypothetical protein